VIDGDARGFRIALADDVYVNPPPGGLDGLAVLGEAGWGVMALPATEYPAGMTGRILADVAEQVLEFHRHGYAIVLIGDGGRAGEALAAVGVPFPAQLIPQTAAQLREFLAAADHPAAAERPAAAVHPAAPGHPTTADRPAPAAS
jgi:hypothetical protein